MPSTFTATVVSIGIVASLAAVGASPSQQQAKPGQPATASPSTARAANGVMRGQITGADTGRGLRRARVTLIAPQLRESRATTTDENGRWEFKDLPAGRYTLAAAKPPYVAVQFGQRVPSEPGKPVDLKDGQVLDALDIRLPVGSVIAGRLLDDLGEPAAFVYVQPMRLQFVYGRRQLAPAGAAVRTNDLGAYRLAGLPPGTYYVANQVTFWGGSSPEDAGIALGASYFPGTDDPTRAQPVTVRAGQTRGDVDFVVSAVKLAKMSGVVLDSEARPLANAGVRLMQVRVAVNMVSSTVVQAATTGADGRFEIFNLAPGDYSVTCAGTATQRLAASEQGMVNVSVRGEDIEGLVVRLYKGSTLKGQIEFEGEKRPPLTPSLRLYASDPTGTDTASMPAKSTIHEDWAFELTGVFPGERLIRMLGLPAGFALKSIFIDGEDVIDTLRKFDGKEELSGVRLVVTDRVTEISGSVSDANGQPLREYSVVAFPKDGEKWQQPGTRRMVSARPDQNGRFSITGLPPDDYLVVAVEYLAAGDERDPEFLDANKSRATSISLADGQRTAINLKVAPRGPSL